MARGFKPTKSTGSSNLFAAGHRDPILKKMLGPALLANLGGKKPRPMTNIERARQYVLQQQAKKEK